MNDPVLQPLLHFKTRDVGAIADHALCDPKRNVVVSIAMEYFSRVVQTQIALSPRKGRF